MASDASCISDVAPLSVTRDLWCAGCGYNLRTLRCDGACPECGRAIEASLRAESSPLRIAHVVRRARFGIIALAVVLAVMPFEAAFAYGEIRRVGQLMLNPDGLRWLGVALLYLPAAWLLMRAAAPLSGKVGRLRRIAAALLVVLGMSAIAMFPTFHSYSIWGNAILLVAYGVAPIVDAALIWALLRMIVHLHDESDRFIRIATIAICWTAGGVLMLDRLLLGSVQVARLLKLFGLYEPPPNRYLPDDLQWWITLLTPHVYRATLLVLWIAVLILFIGVFRLPRPVRP